MFLEGFIASRMKFKSTLSIIAIAISFFVIIISVSISQGFSSEIRKEVGSLCSDIVISNSYSDYYSDLYPINTDTNTSYPAVISSKAVIYRSAIAQKEDIIEGVIVKGVENLTLDSLCVKVPKQLALKLNLSIGDSFTSFFIGDYVEQRDFVVSEIYSSSLSSEHLVVFSNLKDMQDVNFWNENEASVLELEIEEQVAKSRAKTEKLCEQIMKDSHLAVFSSRNKYAELFDWLEMIEYNVAAIILLMSIVAGFNMISGLLILVFRNVSTIGKLKTMGMKNRSIASIFLRAAARISSIGLAIGNSLALLFCLFEAKTHCLKLNPEHYFVSFVPVSVDLKAILIADIVAFSTIMLLLLIPCLFISRIEPSLSVNSE